eukprot:c45419_g1_i1.p1 GENE.c45419_g1_i1~~c45419_g1_i1.p1  ORF type:complete len:210 (-),score=46.98 c45419_g1_i1:37-639(-)
MVKIAIVYYSLYGHVRTLAHAVKEGVIAAGGEATVFQVPETLPQEVLTKMHAPEKSDDPIVSAADLANFDGFLFGFPTRFGMMVAQFKAFLDSTGQLWQAGALVGKPCGMFTSTAVLQGGQETTILTAVTQLAHHGMIFVPIGFSFGGAMFDISQVRGGSAYGASTFAGGDGSRQPSETELAIATHQGKYFTGIAAKLAA